MVYNKSISIYIPGDVVSLNITQRKVIPFINRGKKVTIENVIIFQCHLSHLFSVVWFFLAVHSQIANYTCIQLEILRYNYF
jgi:hypothetical protein